MPRMTRMTENDKHIARVLYHARFKHSDSCKSMDEFTRNRSLYIDDCDNIKWWLKRQAAQDISRCKLKHRK